MNLDERLQLSPFVRILPCFAGGIVAARWVEAPLWVVGIVAAMCYLAAWIGRGSRGEGLCLAATLFCAGVFIALLTAPRRELPRYERLRIIVEADRDPVLRGRWLQTEAHVAAWRALDNGAPWHKARERVMLCMDSTRPFAAGDQLAVEGSLHPISPSGGSYATLMHSRGMDARIYVHAVDLLVCEKGVGRIGVRCAAAVHRWAAERVARLPLDRSAREILGAMLVGEKRAIDPNLRGDYARTGVAHILAVSGLHTGFVLLITNALLGWLVFMRRGHILRNVAVIGLLWLYALMTGLMPSVVRAALMLTAVQLALARSTAAGGINIVLGAATLMLAVRSTYLYDMSFQLSFAAVLGILLFYPRLYRPRVSRPWTLDVPLRSLLLGVSAQIGTVPLVAYYFGIVSIAAVWINLVVVFTAFVTVAAGFVWLLLPFAWYDTLYGMLAGWVLRMQNGAVHWAASTPMAALDDVHPTVGATVGIYVALLTAAVVWKLQASSREQLKIR